MINKDNNPGNLWAERNAPQMRRDWAVDAGLIYPVLVVCTILGLASVLVQVTGFADDVRERVSHD